MSDFTVTPPSMAVQAAYAKTRELPVASGEEVAPEKSFTDLVQETAQQAAETVRTGDVVASAGLSGEASIQQVVEATMAMDSTVRVSVALRDKLVEAYREVMRMPI